MKFNSEQLLFEPFFDGMRNFGIVESQIECMLPFLKNIIFQAHQSFESPSSTLGRDRRLRSRTFLFKIQFRTTFIRTFFDGMRIFVSVEP